ncbi:MAG TPA: hypothetical protein VF743_06385 [Acidimicrobiales bacterium]
MSSGTTQINGHMAGAARPGSCAAPTIYAGTHASAHARMWLGRIATKPVAAVFTTDRPIPRPLERSP